MSYADILKKNLPFVSEVNNTLVTQNLTEDELKNNPQVYVSDTFDNLLNYHYKEIDNDSPQELMNIRGITFENNKIVRRSLPYIPEIVSTELDTINKIIDGVDVKDMKFYNSIESSCLYVWFRESTNTWMISTHKKIDAFNSKWGNCSISFGAHFINGIATIYTNTIGTVPTFDEFCSKFSKENTYAFIVSNTPDNRMVCIPMDIPMVFYVATINNNTGKITVDNCSVAPVLSEAMTYNSLEECIKYVENIDYRYYQGLYCVLPDGNRFKIMNNFYNDLLKARGTDPSIVCRYFRVRTDKNMVAMLSYIYPEYVQMFATFETALDKSIQKIHDAYILRYFNNEHVIIPQSEFYMMQNIRKHCVDNHNDFTLDLVRKFVDNSDPKYVYNIAKVNINVNN